MMIRLRNKLMKAIDYNISYQSKHGCVMHMAPDPAICKLALFSLCLCIRQNFVNHMSCVCVLCAHLHFDTIEKYKRYMVYFCSFVIFMLKKKVFSVIDQMIHFVRNTGCKR